MGFMNEFKKFAIKGNVMDLAVGVIIGGAFNKIVTDLRVVLDNFKVISTYGKTFVGTVARKPWRLVFGGPVPRLPSEEKILNSDKPVPAPIPND